MRLSRILSVLSGLIFFLIVIGGAVRNLQAGLSCPDWPLCHGKIIPDFDIQIFAEYFHRLVAALVSVTTIIIFGYVMTHEAVRRVLGRQVILALLLLLSQVILGGLTVLQLLQSEIVTLHLATGTMFFAVVLLMALRMRRYLNDPEFFSPEKTKKRLPPSEIWNWAFGAFVMVFIQIILGGTVSSHYAGLACADFPMCNGQWWPGLEGVVGIQILHRIGALATLVIVLAYVYQESKNRISESIQTKTTVIATLVCIQVILGISNVIFQLPVALSVAHLAVAEALFGLLLITTYEIRHFQLH